ncbi:uncharacterized protein LOC133038667 isoform X2 [Cannabis sativa]|uniref:uncharacterized protein LOC133038667 isoform X2 n=1 Tax=Cannabis sativa TaxID=3483 RepID=UPI0029CA0479|nr:uncharacterized protein LOC133038667 isoform X2 [Cannabis sativa]
MGHRPNKPGPTNLVVPEPNRGTFLFSSVFIALDPFAFSQRQLEIIFFSDELHGLPETDKWRCKKRKPCAEILGKEQKIGVKHFKPYKALGIWFYWQE